MKTIARFIAGGLIAASFFSVGYGTKSCIAEKKADYSKIPIEQGFYQDSKVELVKKVNEDNNLEIYIQSNNKDIPLKEDLILLDNGPAYDALENRLKDNTKKNQELIDKIFQNSYKLLIDSYSGEKVKENCANPSDLEFSLKKDSEGIYASVNNLQKNETLGIETIGQDIQLGDKEYRREVAKKELSYDLSKGYETFMDKAQKILPWFKGLISSWE
jgi:hypothetical protein